MSRKELDITEDGNLYSPLPPYSIGAVVQSKMNVYTIAFGYDGPLNYFFVDVFDQKKPDSEPLWDSLSVWAPGKLSTPEEAIQACVNAGYTISFSLAQLMIKIMNEGKAEYRDEKTPAMREFLDNLQKDLFGGDK